MTNSEKLKLMEMAISIAVDNSDVSTENIICIYNDLLNTIQGV